MKGERLTLYLKILKKFAFDFENCSLTQFPSEENTEADALANLGSCNTAKPEWQKQPGVDDFMLSTTTHAS